MTAHSTREAANKLGITQATLSTYIKAGKIPPPKILQIGRRTVHAWTEAEIEHVRKLLPKIANGRKTRYSKLREKQKAPAKSPVPRKPKKKK
jgi:predicted DNA-binding transcriptional regulator AlpA